MKRLILICFVALVAQTSGAQSSYTFSKTTAAYSDLSSKTIVESGWTSPFNTFQVTAPIDIFFFGTPTVNSSFSLSNRGYITYNADLTATKFIISPIGTDLAGEVGPISSEISYMVEGTQPSRILKIQFKDVGFYSESPAQSKINFQVWLHEATDVVEMRYGPGTILTANAVPEDVGLYYEDFSAASFALELLNNASNPSVSNGLLIDGTHLLNVPASGTVYRFSPVSTDVRDLVANNIRVWHNGSGALEIVSAADVSGLRAEIYDPIGRKLNVVECGRTHTTIKTGGFTPGVYTVKFNGYSVQFCKKVLIR